MSELNATKRGDLLRVDPRIVKCHEGLNTRLDFDLPDLKNSIRENGVQIPLICYKLKGLESFIVLDGERRLRATNELKEEEVGNEKLILIPIIVVPKPNDIELNVGLVIRNDGKPLLPMELAITYKRLIDLGLTVNEISLRTGKSYSHVSSTIALMKMTSELKEAVKEGKITASTAKKIEAQVKPESVSEVIKQASETAKGKKTKTVQMKQVDPKLKKEVAPPPLPPPPKKVLIPVPENIPTIPQYRKIIKIEDETDIVVKSCENCIIVNLDKDGNAFCLIGELSLNRVNAGDIHPKCPLKKVDFFIRLDKSKHDG